MNRSDNDLDIKKKTLNKKFYKGNNYEKIIKLCKKANIITINPMNNKQMDYPLLIEEGHKRKKEILKLYSTEILKYTTKKGYGIGNFTGTIESLSVIFLKNLKALDKIIMIIENETLESDQRSNICTLLNIKTKNDKLSSDIKTSDYSVIDGPYIAEYSNHK